MRKAIVMAGGQGSRLRPLTLTRPKPMVPVANRPIMAHILEWLRDHGFSEVLVTLHYRADDIRRAFGDGRAFDVRISYRVEHEPLGTAGSVKFAEDWIAGEPFLIASGDALTDLDLAALQRRHRETGAWLTIGLTRVEDPSEYGVVELDHLGRVVRFQEKPGRGRALSNLANTGIYCVEPKVLARVPRGRAFDWSRDVFPGLLAEGLPIFGHALDGYWCDIGSMDAYRRGQCDALEGAVKVALPAHAARPGVWIGANARIAPRAVVEGPVLLGAGCRIEPGARILPGSVIGERAIVRTGACVSNAILGAECELGPDALVRDSVVAEETRIGARCSVTEGSVIGRGCRLTAQARVAAARRIDPNQVLSGAHPLEAALSYSSA
jgi:mannose-1-phosphate guanylyltransferase/phosphomannomutase